MATKLRIWLLLFLLMLQVLPGSAAEYRIEDHYEPPPFHREGVTPASAVTSQFFFELPEPQRAGALQLLGGKEVAALSDEQARLLLGVEVRADSIIDRLHGRIELSVKEAEATAAEPVREEDYEEYAGAYQYKLAHHDYLKRAAQLDREYAAHLLNMRGRLKPYLVKLGARNKARGIFRGWIEGDTMHVLNEFFVGYEEIAPYPVVLYLVKEPKRIEEELVPVAQ